MSFKILFEDDYFLAADKPAGLPCQATVDKTRPSFFTELHKQLKAERGDDTYLALHHRLDRDTSGVMIFAKAKAANTPLADLFKEHRIQKTYVCFTKKAPKVTSWEVKNFLAEAPRTNKERAKMIAVNSGGLPAHTHFEIIEKLLKGFFILARPKTGRMHQIRVHLSGEGYGIFGDDLYPCPTVPPPPRLMLHAESLEFIHPFTQEKIFIESPLPQDMIDFGNLLNP
jgi:RluA family pseudouridine synthase